MPYLAKSDADEASGVGQVLLKGGCIHVDLGVGALLAGVRYQQHKRRLCQAWRHLHHKIDERHSVTIGSKKCLSLCRAGITTPLQLCVQQI